MKGLRSTVAIIILLGGLYFPKEGFADTVDLEKRLNALEQEVAVLKRQLELKKEDEAKKAVEVPIISASSKDGFSIKSPDDNFKLKIRGLLQADARIFLDDKKDTGNTDNFLVRRVRPIFEGTVARDFDFYLMPDFGSGTNQLVDAWIEFKYFPKTKLKGGKFKAPFGLERLQSDAAANFIEVGLPSNLAPNRDVGFQLSGDVLNDKLNYAVGVFDGTVDLGSVDTDNNNDKDLVARVFAHPFKGTDGVLSGLGVGFAATHGHKEGTTLPTYKSTGQASIFTYSVAGVSADGPHKRLSPQLYFYRNSFGLIGEYISSEQQLARLSGTTLLKEKFNNTAWQISSTYVLTGENASYKGVTPRRPFDPKEGGWGAWEVAARYGVLDIDDDAFSLNFASPSSQVSKANAWGLGLNWYLNKNVRTSLDFERTIFDGGAPFGEDRKPENVILTRFQLSY